ncbi:MAG: YecA family protein [Woeseiaceae bacterium]|nr:YecA family protein [Woeseiaceae bacterium]
MAELTIDHHELDAALKRCGSSWNAGQTHGLLCSHLALGGADGVARWVDQVLAGTDPDDALRGQCEAMLDALCTVTWQQLAERRSEFVLLLPDDDDPPQVRTEAMAQWCDGFLHGLVSDRHDEKVRERLASEPLADIIRDLVEISRASMDDDDDPEGNEAAFAELVEYLRVAAQLTYEELAEFRASSGTPPRQVSGTLH